MKLKVNIQWRVLHEEPKHDPETIVREALYKAGWTVCKVTAQGIWDEDKPWHSGGAWDENRIPHHDACWGDYERFTK